MQRPRVFIRCYVEWVCMAMWSGDDSQCGMYVWSFMTCGYMKTMKCGATDECCVYVGWRKAQTRAYWMNFKQDTNSLSKLSN